MDDFEKRAKSIIADQLGLSVDEITPEANFMDDLGADSLDLVEITMAIEEEFGIQISDEEAVKLVTVAAVIDFVRVRNYGKPAGEAGENTEENN